MFLLGKLLNNTWLGLLIMLYGRCIKFLKIKYFNMEMSIFIRDYNFGWPSSFTSYNEIAADSNIQHLNNHFSNY